MRLISDWIEIKMGSTVVPSFFIRLCRQENDRNPHYFRKDFGPYLELSFPGFFKGETSRKVKVI